MVSNMTNFLFFPFRSSEIFPSIFSLKYPSDLAGSSFDKPLRSFVNIKVYLGRLGSHCCVIYLYSLLTINGIELSAEGIALIKALGKEKSAL